MYLFLKNKDIHLRECGMVTHLSKVNIRRSTSHRHRRDSMVRITSLRVNSFFPPQAAVQDATWSWLFGPHSSGMVPQPFLVLVMSACFRIGQYSHGTQWAVVKHTLQGRFRHSRWRAFVISGQSQDTFGTLKRNPVPSRLLPVPPSSSPWQPLPRPLVSIHLPFRKFPLHAVLQYATFCVWLLHSANVFQPYPLCILYQYFIPFSWLNNIPLHSHTTPCSSTHQPALAFSLE